MVFRVEIAPQAFEDLDSIADYIKRGRNTASAERKWRNVPMTLNAASDITDFRMGQDAGVLNANET